MQKRIKINWFNIVVSLPLIIFAIFCLLPFWLVLVNSMTSEKVIKEFGYSLWFRELDFTSYQILLADANRVLNGYKITIIVTVVGTFLGVLITALAAYPLSRKCLKLRRFLNLYVLLTMLLSGGMVPWFIVCRNILHLKDSIFALILPYLANAWNIFLVRNYYRSIPEEINESAKIDGAGELYIWLKLILPLSKPVLATIALFVSLGYWNDWWLGLMLIDSNKLQPLQLMLRTITSNMQFLLSSPNISAMQQITKDIPSEGIKMATCIITIGPILFVYPFVQKFFVKGIMVGSVKG